jgi:N-acetylglucosaminyldiphosphoundecaprenol N-acetyl-beta-D-mannosaminyltransferase
MKHTHSHALANGEFSGVPIRKTNLIDACNQLISKAISVESSETYRLINAYNLALADTDPNYHHLLSSCGVNLPDGRPLSFILRLLNRSHDFEQVRGPSLFRDCLDRGRVQGLKHYFLGGTPNTLSALIREAERQFPGLVVAGSVSPPFRPMTAAERCSQDEDIRASGAQIVWVGLGTPKQDFEAARICDQLGLTTVAVGAAFDFFAKTKREAHPLLRQLGLEWAHRLATEPRRLWRRYLFGNSRFIRLALLEGWRTLSGHRPNT